MKRLRLLSLLLAFVAIPVLCGFVGGGGSATGSAVGIPCGALSAWGMTANSVRGIGFIHDGPVTLSQDLIIDVTTADNSANLYDFGFYYCPVVGSGNCTLEAHTGAIAGSTFAATTGWKTIPWSGTPTTAQAGFWIYAQTGNAAILLTNFCNQAGGVSWSGSASATFGTSTGGALPATISSPSFTPTVATQPGAWGF